MPSYSPRTYYGPILPLLCFVTEQLLSMMLYGMEYRFGQLGSAALIASPLNFMCTPNLLTGVQSWKKRRL